MKNLIRGHIYQLKKDRFFLGCLAFALVFLGISIRVSSFGTGTVTGTGLENMFRTFLNGDMVLYAFMLLTANMIAEAYRSGTIKNIVGRGINKKNYYFSIIFTTSVAYLLVMLVCGIIMGSISFVQSGMGSISYPGYYALSIVARAFFTLTYVSFATTMTILTMNAIAGFIMGLLLPYVPRVLESFFGFLRIRLSFDFMNISSHMPSLYEASNDLSPFFPCVAVLAGYFVFSVLLGIYWLQHQDIK